MEWWLKASLTLAGVSSAFTANYLWREHYRKLGIEHPITAYLRSNTTDEAEDRRKRIQDIAIQSNLSEARLSQLSKIIKTKYGDNNLATGNVSNQQPVLNESWKSDFQ